MGGTVLIVDPCEESRQFLQDLLERSGYIALVAADGIAAWAVACRQRPDLITVRQPAQVYGARALIDSIRANVSMEGVPVLMVSAAEVQPEDWQKGETLLEQMDIRDRPQEFLEMVGGLLSRSGFDDPGSASAEVPAV